MTEIKLGSNMSNHRRTAPVINNAERRRDHFEGNDLMRLVDLINLLGRRGGLRDWTLETRISTLSDGRRRRDL